MNNLIEKIKKILGTEKKYFKKYLVTFATIFITTILMVVLEFDDDYLNRLYVTLILSDIMFFSIETYFTKNKTKIPLYILSFFLSMIATYFIFKTNISAKLIAFIIGTYLVIGIISIYKILADEKLSNFLPCYLQNNIILGVSSSVIQIGIIFIVSIIYELLFNNYDGDLYLKVELLLLGFFLIPGEILCLLNFKENINKFIKILICYIIVPIILISEFVIYLYFIKIFITFNIPSNEIFRITAILFIGAFPTWLMIKYFRNENKLINIISVIMPYSFIPFLIVQIYSVGIRIINYGVTISRYLGIILIIFEVITIIFSIKKYEKNENKIVLSLAMLIIITTILPNINMIDVSYQSQYRRFMNIYNKKIEYDKLSNDDKKTISSSYNYIKYDLNLEDKLPDYNFADLDNKYYKNNNDKNLYYDEEVKEIDIANYTRMIPISVSQYIGTKINVLDLELNELNNYENYSVKDSIKNRLKHYMNLNKVDNNIIFVDDNYAFYITYLNMNYDYDTQNIKSINLDGYLLIKK